ncbi:hypothetical protein, partial [Allokutzneria sp. NRRL B-24872]|uniref:hypothetical protein n=1 Tax=Allokutzneria sp. NRRL B-24872 TaxID=1137961 RepID=UPI000A37073E
MRERLGFDIEVSHNEHLRPGARELDAVLSVTASPLATAPTEPPSAAEVIIFDASAPAALGDLKHAVMAAIDALPDGVAFAVLAGARMAFPVGRQLCPSTPENRAVAKAAVSIVTPTGAPAALGEQLALADRLFVEHEGAVRHALLVTASDSGESEQDLATAADACAGHFVCDCVAVGDGGGIGGLRTVATRLGGSVELVPDPARLATNLVSAVSGVLAKSVTDTAMRLWLPKGARVRLFEQVHPVRVDLTQRRGRLGYRTDAWGAERREYHLRVELDPSGPGQSVIATRARLVRPAVVSEPGEFVPLAAGLVTASWSEEIARTLPLDERVADVLGKADLAKAVRAALAARAEGNLVAANEQFSEAVRHAAEAGDSETLNQLDRVVESDPVTGAVRLKEQPAANGMSVVPKPPKPARRRRAVVQAIETTVSAPSPRPRGRHRRADDDILDAPWDSAADEATEPERTPDPARAEAPLPRVEMPPPTFEKPVEKPREEPVAVSVETQAEARAAAPVKATATAPVDVSGSARVEAPVDVRDAAPVEAPGTTPVTSPITARVDMPITAPVDMPVMAPVDEPDAAGGDVPITALPSITALPDLEPLPEPAPAPAPAPAKKSTVDSSASSWGGWPSLPASPNGSAARQPGATETTVLQHPGRRRKHALPTGETPRVTKLLSQVTAPEPQATTALRRDPAAKPIALTPVPSAPQKPLPPKPSPQPTVVVPAPVAPR